MRAPAPAGVEVAPGAQVCLVHYGGAGGRCRVESQTVAKIMPRSIILEDGQRFSSTVRPGVWVPSAKATSPRIIVGATPELAALAVIEWHNEQVTAAEGRSDRERTRRDVAAESLRVQLGEAALLPALRRLLAEAEARAEA